jgi:RsiW-degrading membrane proteinase PrsW (M82 family)
MYRFIDSEYLNFGAGLAMFLVLTGAWLAYFEWRSKRSKTGRTVHVSAIIGGAFSVLLALGIYAGLDMMGLVADWQNLSHPQLGRAMSTALVIGVVEEIAKITPVLLIWFWRRREMGSLELMVIALCSGLGFAVAESLMFFVRGELTAVTAIARAVAAPITHALFTAPLGAGLVAWLRRGQGSHAVSGFIAATFTHGVYDLLVARPGVSSFGAAAVVLVLWIWLNGQLPTVDTVPAGAANVPAPRPIPRPAFMPAARTLSFPQLRL